MYKRQAWTDEVFSMKRGKMELVASGTHSLLSADGTPLWLVQKGKFAYRILPEYTREAFVTCETRPTDWVKRNKVCLLYTSCAFSGRRSYFLRLV